MLGCANVKYTELPQCWLTNINTGIQSRAYMRHTAPFTRRVLDLLQQCLRTSLVLVLSTQLPALTAIEQQVSANVADM